MSGHTGYDLDGLKQVKNGFARAGKALEEATNANVRTPDAGSSSDAVATTMTNLFRNSVVAAEMQAEIASKVHLANGSFAQTEDDNTARLRQMPGHGGGHSKGSDDSTYGYGS